MEPVDLLWRVLERFSQQLELLEETKGELDNRQHGDLLEALDECEQLTRTQMNILNRMRRRYSR